MLLIPCLAAYTPIINISNLIEMLPNSEQCYVILGHLLAADLKLVKIESKRI